MDIGESPRAKLPKKTINLLMQNLAKPQLLHQKHNEEVKNVPDKPIEYLKPAMTFGEKLWRLNEVSIFSMINK